MYSKYSKNHNQNNLHANQTTNRANNQSNNNRIFQFCAILCKYLMIIGGYLNNNNFNVHIFFMCAVLFVEADDPLVTHPTQAD